jgi:hypothetical protein
MPRRSSCRRFRVDGERPDPLETEKDYPCFSGRTGHAWFCKENEASRNPLPPKDEKNDYESLQEDKKDGCTPKHP